MSRRDKSFIPALCISLIAHGLGLSALAWWLVLHTPPPKLAALDKVRILLNAMPQTALPPPTPPRQAAPPKPKPAPRAEKKPPVKFDKPQADHRDDSGEANGKGTANRSTDGNQPMLASANPNRLEQADLMKAAEKFAENVFLPASKGELTGNNAPPQKAAAQGSNAPDASVKPSDAKVASSVATKSQAGVGPQSQTPQSTAAPSAGAKDPQPKKAVAQTEQQTVKPIEKEILGHRATASDTESIAFANAEHSVFRAGKLEGRKGLRTRITTPRLGTAAEADMESLGNLHLVLGVTVYPSGDVENVVVIESSGSANIDQDFKNEVWNNWNLEPRRDAAGNITDSNWVITCE
jgi:hypothetical protein